MLKKYGLEREDYNKIFAGGGGGLIEGFVTLKETMIILGNLTAIISDHLPQFAINPNMFGNTASNKSNIYEID